MKRKTVLILREMEKYFSKFYNTEKAKPKLWFSGYDINIWWINSYHKFVGAQVFLMGYTQGERAISHHEGQMRLLGANDC
jgi:hypothetical protein